MLIPFSLSFTILVGTVGGAVDFNRWHGARRVTGDALDAAVLAGARMLQIKPNNPQAALDTAAAYFAKNLTGKVDLSVNSITFVLEDANQAITATGNAKINATFLNVLGIHELTVLSNAGSQFPKAKITTGGAGGSNLEVSLVLDVTGSMCNDGQGPCNSSTKLSGLKTASESLIDMVISENQSSYYSKMAIVPFSTRVRVGPDGLAGSGMMKLLTDLDPLWSGYYKACTSSSGGGGSEGGGNWTCNEYQTQYKTAWKIMPCVTDRFYNSGWAFDYTDDAPGSGKWLNAHDGGRMTKSWDSSNTAPTTQTGTSALPAEHWNYSSTGQCADISEKNEIQPLTSNKNTLKGKINDLEAYGSTAGALGTAWGWYTLSPKWYGVWTGQKRPGEYADLTTIQSNGKPLLRKVAIIMSDGVFNTYRGWKDQNQQTISNYAKQLCTNMKAQGIEIFTVGLALDELPSAERAIAEDTLRSCGTDVSHFYATLDVAELQTAFQDIAYQLAGITLTR